MTSKRLWVFSGDRPSNGAKELAGMPGFLRLRKERFHKLRPGDSVVNWGCSQQFDITIDSVLNDWDKVGVATDKLKAFYAWDVGGIKTVQFTEKQEVAQAWATDGSTVVVRNKLTGHSGDGIVIIEKHGDVPTAPLYTKYVFKEKEYRVHVVNGQVIDTQQKVKDPDREVTNWKVRSHDNGFMFTRGSVVPNAARDSIAIDAVHCLGLDFGAVDVIEDKHGVFYVLEINTAPGLEGQTIQSYAEALSGRKSEA